MNAFDGYLKLLKVYIDRYHLINDYTDIDIITKINYEHEILHLIYNMKHFLDPNEISPFETEINTKIFSFACPIEGEFIGYKKCGMKGDKKSERLVKLLIPADAKRSSAFSKKCRCDKAKVLEITDLHTGKACKVAYSKWDPNFKYIVGEMVSVDNFYEDRWTECAPGIHFFMNKEEACLTSV